MNFYKRVVVLLCAALIGFQLTGCVKKESKIVQKESSLEGKVTLWSFGKYTEGLKMVADNFKIKYPKAEVEIIEKNPEAVYSDLLTTTASKDPSPDIVLMEDSKAQYFIKKLPQRFVETTGSISTDKYIKSKIEVLSDGDKLYGFPGEVEPIALAYRTDIFDMLGSEVEGLKTWDEFVDTGVKVKAATGKYMFSFVAGEEEKLFRLFSNQLNGSYFDKEGKPSLQNDKTMKAVSLINRMKNNGILYIASSEEELRRSVKSGEVITFQCNPIECGEMMNKVPELKNKISIMKLPAFEPGGGRTASGEGANLMVMSSTNNKKLAFEFCKFFTSDEIQVVSLFTEYKFFPSLLSAYEAKEFDDYSGYFAYQKVWTLYQDIEKLTPVFLYTSKFPSSLDTIREYVKNTMEGKQDTKTLLEELQKEVEKKIQ